MKCRQCFADGYRACDRKVNNDLEVEDSTHVFTPTKNPPNQTNKRKSLSLSIPQPRGSLGHRWFRNQFPQVFPVLHCPLGLGELQACPFPDDVFPPLPLSALSSSPFHCALQDGFGQTCWTGDMTIPSRHSVDRNNEQTKHYLPCVTLAFLTDF